MTRITIAYYQFNMTVMTLSVVGSKPRSRTTFFKNALFRRRHSNGLFAFCDHLGFSEPPAIAVPLYQKSALKVARGF